MSKLARNKRRKLPSEYGS